MIKIKRRGATITPGKWNSNMMMQKSPKQVADYNEDLTCIKTEISVNETDQSTL